MLTRVTEIPLKELSFDKINKNFAELDVANTVKDIKGPMFADDPQPFWLTA